MSASAHWIAASIPEALHKAILNFGWLLLDQAIRSVVALLINIWLVRYLGPDKLGKYSFGLYIVAFTQALAALALDRVIVRDLTQRPEAAGQILGTACALRLAAGAIGFVGALAACALLRPMDGESLLLVAIMGPSTLVQSLLTIDLWFQSRFSSKFTVRAKLFSFSAVSLTKVLVIVTGAPLAALGATVLVEAIAMSVGLVHVYRRNGGRLASWSFDAREARVMLSQAATLIWAVLATQLQQRVDIVMMGNMLGDHEVGLYSAALRLVEAAMFLPAIAMTSIAPLISRAKTLGEGCFEDTIRAYYKLMGCFGWGFVVPIALVADPIVRWLYGSAYAKSGPLLALLGMRFLLMCFSIARSQFIVNQNVLWIYPITTITGAVINVGLNFVLIPRYGATGAIYASLVSLSVSIFGMDPLWRATRRNFKLMMQGLLMPWSLRLAEFHLLEGVGENSAAENGANGQQIGNIFTMLPGARAPGQND